MSEYNQNSHYTFKYNKSMGRHGWLRLTPAYSLRIVEEIINSLDYIPNCVLEPFSGTGTTELVCSNIGIKSLAYEINPFLHWFAGVKTQQYSVEQLNFFLKDANNIVDNYYNFEPYQYPCIFHIERWWNNKQLEFLARIKNGIYSTNDDTSCNLLKVAFCRTLIEISKASFNHVSTSFMDTPNDNDDFTVESGLQSFSEICHFIYDTAYIQPKETAQIFCHNSISIRSEDVHKYDTVITSPPYPNRISYIRELRPYMYWLDYIKSSKEASELDWSTIGGTWGSATSKLSYWKNTCDLLPNSLITLAGNIAQADNKSAKLMCNYVLKYFEDMALHLQSIYQSIEDNGTIHYIVGNSNFYDNIVPTETILMEIMTKIGFIDVKSRIIRKRNCNKSLYEYVVSAKK